MSQITNYSSDIKQRATVKSILLYLWVMKYSDQSYQQRIEGLFERHQSVQSAGFSPDSYKPGLEGMSFLDNALGNPWRSFRTIHVAGTNGKGSVSSMLTAVLASKGLKVGLYTSPHLIDFRERMKVISNGNCRMPEREWIWGFLDQYEQKLEGRSFFEITTGMAFKWFESEKVDIAVIETGLGGRLDSTNIISPILSVITSIGLDHCAILGSTRAAIAGEKAGIFKPGIPAVVSTRDSETSAIFEDAARIKGCRLVFADADGSLSEYAAAQAGRLDLQGPCQQENLRTVLCALEQLYPGQNPESFIESICMAGTLTQFRGRWERLSDNPETICDIGHNPPALKINFARLEQMKRPAIIVYGIMADKDLEGIAPLMPAEAEYILCAPASSRSMKVDDLYSRLKTVRPELKCTTASSIRKAITAAQTRAKVLNNPIIYIGGSTFVVSEAIESLQSKRQA